MALIGKKAERGGRQHQAQRLAVVHASVATTATAATQRALRQSLQAVPYHPQKRPLGVETNETKPTGFTPTRVELDELERQGARETAAEWVRSARRETLAARAAQATDERIAKLESDLGSAREHIALLENEYHSLQSSLDLTVSENSRLSRRLTESDAAHSLLEETKATLTFVQAERDKLAAAGHQANSKLEETTAVLTATEAERVKLSFTVDETRSKLGQMKVDLATAKAERVTLSFAVDEVNNKRQAETSTLKVRLGEMSERAITAERGLAEAQQKLLARVAESCAIERKFADAILARDAAYKELKLYRSMLLARERQVRGLVRSRSELIETTTTLLRALRTAVRLLAGAEQRIKLFAELFARLEAARPHA
jgi:chromosome segregation ATPase